GLHEPLEVGIRDGLIVAVGKDLPRGPETRVVDAGRRLVVPGLIDLHAHLFDGISQLGVAADQTRLPAGVTTAVEAGTGGEIGFQAFVDRWLEPAQTRTYAFVNLSSIGLPLDDGLELGDGTLRYINVDRIVEVVSANRSRCLGIKIRIAKNQMRSEGDRPLRLAIEAAERADCRIMMHITDPGMPLENAFDLLRPGDIITHLFHGRDQTVVGADGRGLPALVTARERGVRTDIGHGGGSFAFSTARAALADGFVPDTISTDLHVFSLRGTMRDMPTTMSKFLALGVTLDDVIAMSTVNAARSIDRPGLTGSFGVGDPADIAILDDVEGPVELEDTKAARSTAQRQRRA